MNTIPASEVKRRGVAALDEAARKGPVHVIKNNRLAGVYLAPQDYARLQGAAEKAGQPGRYQSVWEFLLHAPSAQKRTKAEIDAWLRKERASWGGR